MTTPADPGEPQPVTELKAALQRAAAHEWRLRDLKAQVRSGIYRVDLDKLADRLVDEIWPP